MRRSLTGARCCGHHHAGKTFHTGDFYPYHSPVAGAEALAALLATRPESCEQPLAALLRDAGVQLLLEPGRALLHQAGATVFRIQGVKDRDGYRILTVDGTSLSLSEQWFNSEYLPDPFLLAQDTVGPVGTFPASVGAATCLESDMLTWRKIPFRTAPRVGDLLVHPNTAGYQMDSDESPFHDLALPPKVVIDHTCRPGPTSQRAWRRSNPAARREVGPLPLHHSVIEPEGEIVRALAVQADRRHEVPLGEQPADLG
ncbi:hypothetical protein [Streptomyces sp. NBC_00105]|uniref:hypothetical protein n=1 Tax=unclassified Streptomyces TaxID=2593676 RepID=UPI00386C11ED